MTDLSPLSISAIALAIACGLFLVRWAAVIVAQKMLPGVGFQRYLFGRYFRRLGWNMTVMSSGMAVVAALSDQSTYSRLMASIGGSGASRTALAVAAYVALYGVSIALRQGLVAAELRDGPHRYAWAAGGIACGAVGLVTAAALAHTSDISRASVASTAAVYAVVIGVLTYMGMRGAGHWHEWWDTREQAARSLADALATAGSPPVTEAGVKGRKDALWTLSQLPIGVRRRRPRRAATQAALDVFDRVIAEGEPQDVVDVAVAAKDELEMLVRRARECRGWRRL
ncbi:hypothetical protein CMK11_11370 [Candidatus Poribacteria bacterium]|nr:hypothetical protein [Candidatus Poribacteria bacterium]